VWPGLRLGPGVGCPEPESKRGRKKRKETHSGALTVTGVHRGGHGHGVPYNRARTPGRQGHVRRPAADGQPYPAPEGPTDASGPGRDGPIGPAQ
jgi:hypothetical protein